MNPREKRLVIAFCSAAGCFALYYIVMGVFVTPAREATKRHENLLGEKRKLDQMIGSELNLATRWQSYAERTFSFAAAQTYDWFGQALKDTATSYGFDAPEIKKGSSTEKLGSKTDIQALYYTVTVVGEYAKTLPLLRAMYETDYITRVSDVSITPDPNLGRDVVKLQFRVSTLLLPEVPDKISRFAAGVKPRVHEENVTLGRWRKDVSGDDYFAILSDRNILRPYLPAPANSILIDNLDPKLVGVAATFYWDGDVESEAQVGVNAGKQERIVGKGDQAEIVGAYADGTEFRQRHTFTDGKPWVYKVPSHTVREPKIVNLAINNQNAEEVRVDVTIAEQDGKAKTLPTMVIAPNATSQLGEFEVQSILVSATYGSGKTHAEKRFTPMPTQQVYLIPPEPKEIVKGPDVPPPPQEDPDPDPTRSVSGLLTYRDVQEMIVDTPDGRKVIRAGEDQSVDGGTLYAVCPLGGIVYMPNTRRFYLYPRGENFGRRVLLSASSPDELGDAIYEWSQR